VSWSDGQSLGLEQLQDIADASEGHLTIETVVAPPEALADGKVTISLTTRHLPRGAGGIPLRQRERFVIRIPQRFPNAVPVVNADHQRFAGYPHVQWGSQLCLYQSPDLEYAASDGMYGYIARLNAWLRAAALNELDPEDAPLHPPAVYATADERIIVRPNTPDIDADAWHWLGAAHLAKRNERRLDLTGWASLDDLTGEPQDRVLAAAIIFKRPLPFEYPDTVLKLLTEVVRQDVPLSLFIKLIRLQALSVGENDPLYVVIGAPMRRREAGAALKHHLAVWRIEPEAALNLRRTLADETGEAEKAFYGWAATAGTTWCTVHDVREEVTIRRDRGASTEWVKGKRILLLGCGALGSPIAEYLVRAGAARLDLADNGVVKPGLLVRQNFTDADVGFGKSHQLKRRLDAIGMGADVHPHWPNLTRGVFGPFERDAFDLVIDATASNPVARALERDLAQGGITAPLISLSVSAMAEHGAVLARMPGFAAGPVAIARRAKLDTLGAPAAAPFAAAFWPKANDMKLFQPEPGCSEPTFSGSSADLAFHASALLELSLQRLSSLGPDEASVDFEAKPTAGATRRASQAAFTFAPPIVLQDPRHGYRVLFDRQAEREMTSWIARSRRSRGAKVETGGLMFGEIDESLTTVWLDRVSGPPPDSEASAEKFLCGVKGTQALAEHHRKASDDSLRFIGIWHTHPVSMPQPSIDDLNAMLQLLVLEEQAPRAVLMLIVGYSATSSQLGAYVFRRKDFMPLLTAARAGR